MAKRALVAACAGLAGLGLLACDARWVESAGAPPRFVWSWAGRAVLAQDRAALLALSGPPAVLVAAALACLLGSLVSLPLARRLCLSRARGGLLAAATSAVLFLACDPGIAAFVARRSEPSAAHWLDAGDALRGLGVALVGCALCVLLARAPEPAPERGEPPARGARAERRERLSVALAALLAVLAPATIARAALGGAPLTNDEAAYLYQARLMAHGELALAPELPLAAFPARQVAVADGRVFGKYPPGHPAVLAVGTALGLPELLPRLLAAAAVFALWRLARRAGLVEPALACWLLVLSPMVLGVESLWLSHATSLPGAVLFALAALVARERAESGRPFALAALGAGACLSLVALARPVTALGVGAPFVVGLLVLRPRGGLRLLALGVLGALPAAAFFLHVNRAQTGDALLTAYEHYARTVSPNDRFGLVNLPTALEYTAFNLSRLATWLSGNALSLLLPALGIAAGARGLRHAPLFAGVPCALLALYSLHRFQGGPWVGPLYLVEGVPFLALFAAHGASALRRALGAPSARAVLGVAALGSALLLALHFEAAAGEAALRDAPRATAARAGVRAGLVLVPLSGEEDLKRHFLPPPLPGEELVFARDLGLQNAVLRAALGEPPTWVYRDATLVALER